MRVANQLFVAMLVVLATTTPLYAANDGAGTGMGLAIVGIGLGIGLIGYAALSGIARQPEQAGAIQGAMYVLAGLVEGAGIIALILCLVLGLKG
jgi:F0F1-type ATP synthase membrane subunit c/vacuolar-type H+-ATPase subunit K